MGTELKNGIDFKKIIKGFGKKIFLKKLLIEQLATAI